MSLGYCNTFVTDLNPENTNRNLLDAGLPSRFKLLGVLFNPTEKYSSGATANTIETFRIYDGDSDDGLILTFPITLGLLVYTSNGGDFIMQNDSYIPIESGLYYKASNANLGSSDFPISITLMYV